MKRVLAIYAAFLFGVAWLELLMLALLFWVLVGCSSMRHYRRVPVSDAELERESQRVIEMRGTGTGQ